MTRKQHRRLIFNLAYRAYTVLGIYKLNMPAAFPLRQNTGAVQAIGG